MCRQQKTTETRQQYLRAARAYAARQCRQLRETPDFEYCHESHAVARALHLTEKRFTDLGTFGVEGDCAANGEDHIDIQYLNASDSYELTLIHWKGRFIVGCWGDIAEKQLA